MDLSHHPTHGSITGGTIDLGEALTIYTVDAQAAQLRDALQTMTAVTLDLERVTTCDSLGIQLLCVFRRSAAALGKSVRWRSPSAAVQRAATVVACEALFTDPS